MKNVGIIHSDCTYLNRYKRLTELMNKNSASFITIQGRRRIGKSRLIEEFSSLFDTAYFFSGLPPEKKTTAKHQLDEFSRQLSRELKTANAKYDDWSDAFWALGEKVKTGKTLILFDEISWMGSKEPTFLGKIKNLWDSHLKKNDQLIFIVCGSASSWIEKNILSSTGFVGRISLTLNLEELSIAESNQFWPKNISSYEKLKILAVTGGVPKYLEEVLPHKTAEDNINRLCFSQGGFLVNEFEQIFSDIFLRKTDYYKKIVQTLLNGSKDIPEICKTLGIARHGRIPEYLKELITTGFISKEPSWNLKTGHNIGIIKYRLSDNYLRFYLKYIESNLDKIQQHLFNIKSLDNWLSIIGLQFENLVIRNRISLYKALDININEIICSNPYYQKKTKIKPGCQIDYMIQTKFQTLFICEIKFSKHPIGSNVITEVQHKIDSLKKPKGFSCRPVLIHINGITEDLIDTNYFSNIISFEKLM